MCPGSVFKLCIILYLLWSYKHIETISGQTLKE